MDYNREARIIPLPIGAVVSVGKNKIANTGKPANYDVPLRKEPMNQPARDEVELPKGFGESCDCGVKSHEHGFGPRCIGWPRKHASETHNAANCEVCAAQEEANAIGAHPASGHATRATLPTPVEDEAVQEFKKALTCLYLAVPEEIARDVNVKAGALLTRLSQTEAEKNVLVDLLQRFLDSGVEVDDPRMGYAVMQIDHRDLQMARVAVKSFETAATEGKDK